MYFQAQEETYLNKRFSGTIFILFLKEDCVWKDLKFEFNVETRRS